MGPRDILARMGLEQLSPQALADCLLAIWLRYRPETLSIEPIANDLHTLSIEHVERALLHMELDSALADAVIARLAVIANLDFTSSDERAGDFAVRVSDSEVALSLVVRPTRGHLSGYVRAAIPEKAVQIDDEPEGEVPRTIGEYVIVRELGRGGLGVVYRAEHRLLHKPAAIKLLTASARAALSNAALLREARAAARTRHPGVVEVYDVVRLPDGRYALIMELIEGETLSARLVQNGPFQPTAAVSVVRMIAEIMEAMHTAGIVHRDLKPDNVFLLPDGRLKLLDFGAARPAATDGGTVPDSTFGTPWYMAPEQACGLEVDRRSDVYSLGCILYELLTGELPFNGTDPRLVLSMHMQDEVPTPKSPHGPLPAPLEALLLRALSKRPQARQQSMAELVREMEDIAGVLSRAGWRKWLTR